MFFSMKNQGNKTFDVELNNVKSGECLLLFMQQWCNGGLVSNILIYPNYCLKFVLEKI